MILWEKCLITNGSCINQISCVWSHRDRKKSRIRHFQCSEQWCWFTKFALYILGINSLDVRAKYGDASKFVTWLYQKALLHNWLIFVDSTQCRKQTTFAFTKQRYSKEIFICGYTEPGYSNGDNGSTPIYSQEWSYREIVRHSWVSSLSDQGSCHYHYICAQWGNIF